MKKIVVCTLLGFIGFSAFAQKKYNLQEALSLAMEHNISIRQSMLDAEAAELDKLDATGNFIPSVNLQGSNTWNTGLTQNVTTGVLQTQTVRNFSANATASLTLFDGLRNFKQAQRAKLSTLAAQYSLEKMKDDIALMVANNYLTILQNKANLEILNTQHLVTEQQIDQTKELVDGGELPRADLLEAQAQYASEEQQIVAAENAVQISLIGLAQMLSIKDYKNFDIVDDDYQLAGEEMLLKNPQEIVDAAKQERYEIQIAEKNMEIAQKDLELSRGAYYPTLSAFINYNTRESGQGQYISGGIDPDQPTQQIGVVETTGDAVVAPNTIVALSNPRPFFEQLYLNDGITYGFQLNIPLLNGFAARNQVKRSKVNALRAEYNLEQAQLDLESNVYQAYLDAQGALKSYQAAQAAIESTKLASEYAQIRYEEGLSNAFEYNQVKQRYDNALLDLNRTKYDYIFKLKVLELYFGIPITELKF
ncbi:MAG: transporter [Cytophagaceae bacterium]|nr:transporter [Cytophagaceae bacterium]